MNRFIKILKEFQNNSQALLLTYLTAKFSLTIRTLQKDIQRINSLLAEVSNCKIVKNKDQLVMIGDNPEVAINNLLEKLSQFSDAKLIKINQLFLLFVVETKPIANSKLLDFVGSDLYCLKQQLGLLNNFFQYYQLNLSLEFKIKKGWILVGCEEDLRFLTTSILISLDTRTNINSPFYPSCYLDANLYHLFDKLEKLLRDYNVYKYYHHEIFYFLLVSIKRIRLSKFLHTYHYHFLLGQLINKNYRFINYCNDLINLMQKNFMIKFNKFEIAYFKSLMLLKQKNIDSSFFTHLIIKIKNFISDLILQKYQFLLTIKNFKLTLDNFLTENYLKLLFNFYKSFSFNNLKKRPFLVDDSYFYGYEILTIINFAFQKYNININFNLFVNDYFLMNFNSLYLQDNQKDWIIPLYYQHNNSFYHQINKIIIFIKNKYPNVILKSLNINNNFYKLNFLNKNYTILLDNQVNFDLLRFRNIFPLKYNYLQSKIDLTIKMIKLNKLCSSILVLDFFLKQKFYNLATFLTFLASLLVRKFKINWIDFDLKNAFIYKKFFQNNILLVHKLIPINNSKLPIILVYLKNPLFFHHKNPPIHFVFILLNSSHTLYQYEWMLLYLNLVKNNFNPKINNVRELYQMINSLSFKNLVCY